MTMKEKLEIHREIEKADRAHRSTVKLLTIRDAAAALSVSVNTVRSMLPKLGAVDLKRGGGKNRQIRIPEEAIIAYLRGCEIMDPLPEQVITNRPFWLERRKA